MGIFKAKRKAPEALTPPEVPEVAPEPPPGSILELPTQFLWLADAPLFIDNDQVESFYDAILRPDYELSSLTLENGITRTTSIGGSATVGAALPWFGKAELTGNANYEGAHDRSTASALTPVSNSYRHLLSMALHYAGLPTDDDHPARLITHDASSAPDPEWLSEDYIQSPPRALMFLDLPSGTTIMPAAMELAKGKVDVLATKIETELKLKGEQVPKWPGPTATADQKRAYFQGMKSIYDNQIALEAVEDAAKRDEIAWVDFNVPLDPAGSEFLHLHVASRESFDTGVFAYEFRAKGISPRDTHRRNAEDRSGPERIGHLRALISGAFSQRFL